VLTFLGILHALSSGERYGHSVHGAFQITRFYIKTINLRKNLASVMTNSSVVFDLINFFINL
jgi:hypothetical protein